MGAGLEPLPSAPLPGCATPAAAPPLALAAAQDDLLRKLEQIDLAKGLTQQAARRARLQAALLLELLQLPELARAVGLAAGLRAAQRFAGVARSHGSSMRQMLPRLCEDVQPQLFVVGGCVAGTELACLQHYDPQHNVWDVRQAMPTERRWCSGAHCMGKIYVVGGQQDGHVLATVERYDVEMDVWEAVPDMPTAREACAVATCGSCLYVCGGCQHDEALAVTECLNIDTATMWWECVAEMPCGRDACAAASLTGRVFVVGGRCQDFLSSADMLQVQSNRWLPLPPMPTPRLGCSAAAVGKHLFVFGGHAGRGRALAAVERLDTSAFVWEAVAEMPTPRLGCVSLCHRPSASTQCICVFGGHNGQGAIAAAECMDVAENGDVLGWRPLPCLPTPTYACAGGVSRC
ncbi:KLHL18 [Symbiodinium pilosum]|uniref:KLHL18 protein n=1 Tax=Symbiodinium pilosum TaxID=2952 RepID=A0A812QQ62_SYMPI|nr:KLHL18 [Symbiodinium pilosum]